MPHPMIAVANNAEMTIVLSQQAGLQEENAAKELLYYLERITGACFSIEKAASAQAVPTPAIALGEAALWLGLDEPRGLGEDGFVIRTLGDSLALFGGCRGRLYAAYELLERLGCRFFTPLCEKVPTCENLELPDMDCRQVPVLECRYHNYKDFTDYPRFSVKRRINGPVPIGEDWGGRLAYA
ncbi:MAG: hypothetical protein PHG76_06065, partial [Eubacteriales bacterium]|nr:hypothetical protein [Eubacteriales bacterium]